MPKLVESCGMFFMHFSVFISSFFFLKSFSLRFLQSLSSFPIPSGHFLVLVGDMVV